MRSTGRALLVVLILGLVVGCKKKKPADEDATPTVRGSGVGSFETRQLPPFTRLKVGGALEVTINVGKVAPLELRGEDNLIKLVPSTVVDGELELAPEAALHNTQPLRLTLGTERLDQVLAAIACRVTVHGVKSDAFTVNTGGAARVTIDGSASKLTAIARRGSQLDLSGFAAGDVTANATDSAHLRLGYVEKLDITQAGAAMVTYRGKPDIKVNAERAQRVGPENGI